MISLYFYIYFFVDSRVLKVGFLEHIFKETVLSSLLEQSFDFIKPTKLIFHDIGEMENKR